MPSRQIVFSSVLLLPVIINLARFCQAAPELSELNKDRQSLQAALSHFPTGASTGILVPAGGREQLTNCAALVIVLREYYQSELPIEVFYNGQAEHYSPALDIIEVKAGCFLQSCHCCLALSQQPFAKIRVVESRRLIHSALCSSRLTLV